MKQLIILFFTVFLLTSCNEKIVQLPETTNKNITEVIDVSPVYMFYDEETDSVEFNRRNMISSTNWLVNIDKRLTLKQILPHLQYLQEKRHGDGMHTNENARNFFTCNNTELKNLSFIEFTDVVYETDIGLEFSKDLSTGSHVGLIDFNSSEKIETTILLDSHGEILDYSYDEFYNYVEESIESGKLTLRLSFNSNLTFQDYIKIKSNLLEMKSDSLNISNQEIIYN